MGAPLERYYDGEITPFYPFDDDLSFDERVVRYNWQAIVNHDNVNLLNEIVSDGDQLILISSTNNESEADPVKAWLWENGWSLIEKHAWGGYGDPEILVFE